MRNEVTDEPADAATNQAENALPASDVTRIHRSAAPSLALCTESLLYFRCNDFAHYLYADKHWQLLAGGRIAFDTYFNALSVRRWRRTATLADLSLEICFTGRLTVELFCARHGHRERLLEQRTLEADADGQVRLPLEAWRELDDGIIYPVFHALTASTLAGFRFVTRSAPLRRVKLGICITHFNRRQQVIPAIARLRAALLTDVEYTERVALLVVDNSNSLMPAETAGATLIPNRNYGGAGGFTRGLLTLQDDGSFTHALFMDDDASCEVESIRRTIDMLAFATEDRLAIAGTMLREAEPYRQFERGARFNGLCQPLRSGWDLRDRETLIANEFEEPIEYGAWWYFAFPLKWTQGLPFPFFVRGDDIDFSLRNKFHIEAMNGVASWQEDFSFKHGPLNNYLDTRNHLLQVLNGLHGGRMTTLYICLRMFALANLAGQYETARAATIALEDVLKGPQFFRDNADLAAPRARLRALVHDERMQPIDPALLHTLDHRSLREAPLRTALRWLTLNGHLLPLQLFYQRPIWLDKSFGLPLRGTFARREIVAYHEPSGTGMRLRHSKVQFFANLWSHARAMVAFQLAYTRLGHTYRTAYPDLTSDRFWRDKLFPVASTPGSAATPTHEQVM